MNSELEGLLHALHAYMESRDTAEEQRKFALYEAQLEDLSARKATSKDILHIFVKKQYGGWLRAQDKRVTTIPPKA